MKKENIVFALYVASAIAVTAHAGVEIWKTFRSEKPVETEEKENVEAKAV